MLAKNIIFWVLIFVFGNVFAQPKLEKNADFSPLINPESGYIFETLYFSSKDGKRDYRLYLGIPKREAPENGYPILYALDGNAILENLNPAVFQKLKNQPPFILALLGYATDLRLDTTARAYDYTPALYINNQKIIQPDALHPNRKNGGADDFAGLILEDIKSAIIQRTRIDFKRQTLWGHSYGGVFALYMLSHYPGAFNQYIAADPALWYQNGIIIQNFYNIPNKKYFGLNQKLWVHQSGVFVEKSSQAQTIRAVVPRQATPELVDWLNAQTALAAQYEHFPDADHGALLHRSFLRALDIVTADN